jgi:predicted metal-dependent hydrolase
MTTDRDRNAEGRAENQRPRDRTGRPLPYDTAETALAEEVEYATVDDALAWGVARWDEERFFEAHECLEDVWHHAPPEDREFWKGVIQVAVGCVHHQRGNPAGAVTLLERAAGRLEDYPDVHRGVDVEQLIVFTRGAVAAIRDAGFCVEVGYPEFPRMDDGPYLVSPDAPPVPLTREPAWRAAARDATTRSDTA